MREPKEYAAEIETGASLPGGRGERFSGYGVIGLPFASGHILALRRFATSSIGARLHFRLAPLPRRRLDVLPGRPPQQACSRYFGSAVADVVLQDISVEWTGPRNFTVRGDGGRSFAWQVTVAPTAATALMNAAGGADAAVVVAGPESPFAHGRGGPTGPRDGGPPPRGTHAERAGLHREPAEGLARDR